MKKRILAWKTFSLIIGSILLFINLPLITKRGQTLSPWGSIHLLVDISNSMNTKDSQGQSRLQRAINLSKRLISSGQTKYSLTIFSSTSNLLIPPTKDTQTFLTYLNSLNTNLLPASWNTNILSPLSLIDNFASTGDQIIILSDFDFYVPSKTPLKKPYKVSLIGVGSSNLSQVTNAVWEPITSEGRPIRSKREDKKAKALASVLGGKYYINEIPKELMHHSSSNLWTRLNYSILVPLILIGLWL